MTFLILFVSTLGMISVTYYFAVERVNAQSQTLKVVNAKQELFSLDQDITSVLWQPGSARAMEILDSGGKLNIEPATGFVTISITDNQDINETIYNVTTGQVRYELPYSDSPDTGLFLKGDSRTVTNQSGASITQLFITNGEEYAEIRLRYRPTVSYATAGTEDNRPINNIRIYVVNMNTSDAVSLYGKLPFRISCESVQLTSITRTLTYAVDALMVTSVLGSDSGEARIPVSSTAEGAVINIEIVECSIKIQRSIL